MSSDATDHEPELTDRIGEHPSFTAGKAARANSRDLAIRFAAGAATSVLSGAVGLIFGPRAGGIFLAFPAILVASLTLIEKKEDSVHAREDSRGAIAGACAMALFAITATIAFAHLAGAIVLVIAGAVWLGSALGLYFILWWRLTR